MTPDLQSGGALPVLLSGAIVLLKSVLFIFKRNFSVCLSVCYS